MHHFLVLHQRIVSRFHWKQDTQQFFLFYFEHNECKYQWQLDILICYDTFWLRMGFPNWIHPCLTIGEPSKQNINGSNLQGWKTATRMLPWGCLQKRVCPHRHIKMPNFTAEITRFTAWHEKWFWSPKIISLFMPTVRGVNILYEPLV